MLFLAVVSLDPTHISPYLLMDEYGGVGPWISSIYPFSISSYCMDEDTKMVWLVPGFPQYILSPYLLKDEYSGVGPWISSIYPFSISTYGWIWWGWSLDFLYLSLLHIYLRMNIVGLVPGFPQFILSPYLPTVWMKIWRWCGWSLDFLYLSFLHIHIRMTIWWGRALDFLYLSLLHIYLRMTMVGVGPWISSIYPYSIST